MTSLLLVPICCTNQTRSFFPVTVGSRPGKRASHNQELVNAVTTRSTRQHWCEDEAPWERPAPSGGGTRPTATVTASTCPSVEREVKRSRLLGERRCCSFPGTELMVTWAGPQRRVRRHRGTRRCGFAPRPRRAPGHRGAHRRPDRDMYTRSGHTAAGLGRSTTWCVVGPDLATRVGSVPATASPRPHERTPTACAILAT